MKKDMPIRDIKPHRFNSWIWVELTRYKTKELKVRGAYNKQIAVSRLYTSHFNWEPNKMGLRAKLMHGWQWELIKWHVLCQPMIYDWCTFSFFFGVGGAKGINSINSVEDLQWVNQLAQKKYTNHDSWAVG